MDNIEIPVDLTACPICCEPVKPDDAKVSQPETGAVAHRRCYDAEIESGRK